MKVIVLTAAIAGLLGSGAIAAPQKKAVARKASPAAAKAAPKAPAVFYDFKGAKLGMTIAEWKALPFPGNPENSKDYGSKSSPPIAPVCKGDPGSDKMMAFVSDAEKASNVIVCQYGYEWKITDTYTSFKSAYVSVGTHITDDVEYKFLDGKLYEINITGSNNLLSDVMDGLTAKFGAPTSVVNDTTQNKAGATFPHTEKTWSNPVASIHMETPYTKIDNMNVTYLAADATSRIVAAEKALHPSADKM